MSLKERNRTWNQYQEYDDEEFDDDGPLLKYRYYTNHLSDYTARRRRSSCGGVARMFLFSMAAILICFMMYFPVYRSANRIKAVNIKGIVAGWSVHTNRDTRIYVKPGNVTTKIIPRNICNSNNSKLHMIVFVCSNLNRTEHRKTIRKTWGNNIEYKKLNKMFKKVRQRYKNYNFSYDLEMENNYGYNKLIESLAKVYKNVGNTSLVPEKDQTVLPEFDMDEQFNDDFNENIEDINYDYNYESNVMRIPPKGLEDNESVQKILDLIKNSLQNSNTEVEIKKSIIEEKEKRKEKVEFKVVFLVGLPADNNTKIQGKIEREAEEFGDLIQEDFVDTYNNLTLKSIMMLKWVLQNCDNKVRYILKSDDDTFINMPILMSDLQNQTIQYERNKLMYNKDGQEYLLLGNMMNRAKPVLDYKNKWFNPPYMYAHRIYPPYLSGSAYLMSVSTARALYGAALSTPYLHLEDIFITGLCSNGSTPRIKPKNSPFFTRAWPTSTCMGFSYAVYHYVSPKLMAETYRYLFDEENWDRCERQRLNKIRQDQIQKKLDQKKKKIRLTRTLNTLLVN